MGDVRRPSVERTPSPRGENQVFVKLKAMKCFGDVDTMLRSGMQVVDIARLIQGTFGEYLDVTPETLQWTLREYRKTLTPAEVVGAALPSLYAKQVERLDEGIDELVMMEELLNLQMGRVRTLTETERNLKFPLRGLDREVQVALQIMKARADLKMDLGINGKERQLGTLTLDRQGVEMRYGANVASGLAAMDSRKKVTSIVSQVLSLRKLDPDRKIIDTTGEEVGKKTG
jgi:hypothetical protein